MAEARQAQGNRPLWICPDCGARLVSRNLWHSCGSFTFDRLFGDTDPQVRDAASRIVGVCEGFGDVQVIPQKSRLALAARVRFSVLLPRKRSVVVGFALHRWVTSPRVVRTDDFGPRWRYHYVRVADAASIDDELIGWLRESHDVVGMQAGLE